MIIKGSVIGKEDLETRGNGVEQDATVVVGTQLKNYLHLT